MTLVRRILKALAAALAFAVYVCFAAVHNVERVKRRKAARGPRRGSRWSAGPARPPAPLRRARVWLVVLVVGGRRSGLSRPALEHVRACRGPTPSACARPRGALRRAAPTARSRVVFRVRDAGDLTLVRALQARGRRAARRRCRRAGRRRCTPRARASSTATSSRRSSLADAKGYSDELLAASAGRARRRGSTSRARRRSSTSSTRSSPGPHKGEADRDPDRARRPARRLRALARGRRPVHLAACTITGTLGIVWGFAHIVETPTYVTNLVQLIGLGIAIDYSLLIVYRFREELARGARQGRGGRADDGDGRARGRVLGSRSRSALRCSSSCRCRSCARWASAGFLIPSSRCGRADAAAGPARAARPARRAASGRRRVLRRRSPCPLPSDDDPERGSGPGWRASIMGRPARLSRGRRDGARRGRRARARPRADAGLDVRNPAHPESVRGFDVLREAVGPGALTPTVVLADAGGARGGAPAAVRAASTGSRPRLERDPEVARVDRGPRRRYVDATWPLRHLQRRGPHEYGVPRGAGVRPPAARRA